jgi:hypothetical protein
MNTKYAIYKIVDNKHYWLVGPEKESWIIQAKAFASRFNRNRMLEITKIYSAKYPDTKFYATRITH